MPARKKQKKTTTKHKTNSCQSCSTRRKVSASKHKHSGSGGEWKQQ